MDRDRGFAVVEARAVNFRLPQTCSPIHVDKCSLKTRWTSTPQQMPAPEEIQIATTRITRPANFRICLLIDGFVIAGFVGDDVLELFAQFVRDVRVHDRDGTVTIVIALGDFPVHGPIRQEDD